MSYSVGVRGKTKALAMDRAVEEFKKIIASQPAHALDEVPALKAREEAIALIGEAPEGKDVYISMSGSLSWTGTYPESHKITSASVSVSVGYIDAEQPK